MLTNLLKLISSTITLASLFMIRTSLSSHHRYIPFPIAWGISLFSVHKEIERKFIPVQYHHNHNPSFPSSLIIIIRNQLFIRRRRCSLTVSLHSRSLERSVAQKMWQGLWTWACWYGLLRWKYLSEWFIFSYQVPRISTSVDGEVIDVGTVKDAPNIDDAMDAKEWLIL